MADEIKDARDLIVLYLQDEMIGPRHGETEILFESPYPRYSSAILFPQSTETDLATAEEIPDDAGQLVDSSGLSVSQEQGDDPVVLANQVLPASMGLSFYLIGDPRLKVRVTAGRYEQDTGAYRKSSAWRRIPLTTDVEKNSLVIPLPDGKYTDRKIIFGGFACLDLIWRPLKSGWLVTVSLINLNTSPDQIDSALCLFQTQLTCWPVGSGRIVAYPHSRTLTDDRDEHILDLLYRHQAAYGVGHGTSVDWDEPVDGSTPEIRSEFLPRQEVPDITFTFDQADNRVLNQLYLSQAESDPVDLISRLERFVDGYSGWIGGLKSLNQDIPADLMDERDLLLERLATAAERMRSGIRVLQQQPVVMHAFCLANRAMLLQYIHSRDLYSGTKKPAGSFQYIEPDPSSRPYCDRTWRPFQLAFQLLALPSVAYPEDPYRSMVDLIWFPTGGGKTEAYLAVSAFIIFYRRLMHGTEASGVTVIMRYTLRLLATQQFQRAASLLCACELIRRENPDELGNSMITIGLWVGASSTPNTYQEAYDKLSEYKQQPEIDPPFQIDRCPWCGAEIIPSTNRYNQDLYGIRSTKDSFSLYCPQSDCTFHEELPISVVDDQIYDRPPTLLLATVDKFARMAWVDRSIELFGAGVRRPPELIIQDELHLISGPLGTIVGLYEVAIDVLASWQGTPPKILASTATIRQADEQCQGLYARQVSLFPPSGLDSSDSYFARYDKTKPGRLFVGVMSQGHTGSTSMIRTSAALLQAPLDLQLAGSARDAFWTLVAYHNSLRELGKVLTFAADDIPARIEQIARDQNDLRDLMGDQVVELTSNRSSGELVSILNRLQKIDTEPDSISFLVCSNMLSVGVDVSRLSLMLVNGQPKSTSEYIQATSRIGRFIPGLVVTLLSPTKPRDRSHYERFRAYHSALYRFVEPTSVTPFAPPARDRALHAALVIGVRHAIGLNENNAAGDFDLENDQIQKLMEFIRNRASQVDPLEQHDTAAKLQELADDWTVKAGNNRVLLYDRGNKKQYKALLCNFDSFDRERWPTLHSMRNVDQNSIIRLITRYDR